MRLLSLAMLVLLPGSWAFLIAGARAQTRYVDLCVLRNLVDYKRAPRCNR
jgi:hypothetical protein